MSEHELNRLLKDKRRAEAKGNLHEVAEILNAIGEIYSKLGKHEEAIEQHQLELQLSEALDDTVGAAVAHRKIGECHCQLADFDKALHHQKLHLVLAEKAGSDAEIQRAHATLGRTYLFQAEALSGPQEQRVLKKAELAFWKSFEVCKRLESTIDSRELMEMKSRLLLNLALVHENRGETDKCSELMKRAIHLAEKGNLYEDLHRCHYTLSDMFERSGRLNHALRSIDTSIKCAQKAKDKFAEWEAIEKKAKIFLQIKDFVASRKCLKKTLKSRCPSEQHKTTLENLLKKVRLLSHYNHQIAVAKETDHCLLLRYNEKMADLFADLKLYKPALDYYHRMLDHAIALNKPPHDLIPVYVSLSQTYKDDKQYEKAIIYFRKEIECHGSNHSQVCRTLLNIAESQELAREDYSVIKATYEEALKHAMKANNKKLQFLVLKSLSIVQKIYKDEDLVSTEAKLQKMMTSYGFTMDDELSDIDSQERDGDEDEEEESDISLEDFTDTDTSEDEEFNKVSADVHPNVGQARRMASVKRNEKGETPLHRACIDGKLRTVKTLVEKGHPINPRDFCGWLPLHEAANHGYVDIVTYLIDKGALINDRGGEKCNGVTPLHDAAANGNLDIVKLLVERGANVHAKDDEGNTALDCLRDYRKSLGEDIGRMEMAEILNIERLLSRTMNGNNPHLIPKAGTLDIDEELDEIPELISRNSRKAKKRRSNHIVGDDDDNMPNNEDDTINEPPLLQVDLSDLDQLQNPCTARAAYRDAITDLGSATSKTHAATPHHPAGSANKGPALVSADQVAGDDWLVEDIRPTMKRKRLDVDSVFKDTNINKKRRSVGSQRLSSKNHRVRLNVVDDDDDDDGNDEEYCINDEEEDDNDERNWAALSSTNKRSMLAGDNSETCVSEDDFGTRITASPAATHLQRSKQLTLTQCSSVSRSVQRSSQCWQANQQRVNTNDMTASASSASGSVKSTILRFRVKIKDVTLLVPIQKSNDEPLISVLAEAASERYYKMFNIRPILSLAKDGAMLSADEPISLVLSNNEEVDGIIDGWDLPPISVRYVDACKSLKTTVYRNIQTALNNCETDQRLRLINLSLRPMQFLPITRALQYQAVKELHLKGNKLSDSGVQHLANILHTLSNLTVIDLSSNNMTSSGLATLVNSITTTQGNPTQKSLQSLEVLILSHNPLTDRSTSYLITLIQHLPQLTSLCLAACQLTVRFFQDQRITLTEKVKASGLQTIDMSYNNLGRTGIELLLMCFNPQTLCSLNISYTISSCSNVTRYLENYILKADCVLEKLFVDGCFLSNDNMADICRFVSKSRSLQVISLSNNPKLNLEDFHQLIRASQNSCLHTIVITGCFFNKTLSTDFLDALSSKMSSDLPLKKISFQTDGSLNEVDRTSLRQIWLDKWSENGSCEFVGGMVMLSSTEL